MNPLIVAKIAKAVGALVLTAAGRVVIKYGPKVMEKGKDIIVKMKK